MTNQERGSRICKNCDHFFSKNGSYGECRLSPPQFVFYVDNAPEERGPVFSHPHVNSDNFCGQFKPKINLAELNDDPPF